VAGHWAGAAVAIRVVRTAQVTDPIATEATSVLVGAGPRCGAIREEHVAAALRVHPSTIGRRIRLKTGLSWREWTWGIRCQCAVHKLATTDDSIKEVAYDSGFGDPNGHGTGATQLNRRLLAMLGLTPGELRRMISDLDRAGARSVRRRTLPTDT
jgi:AraC-like DNA-binding protein